MTTINCIESCKYQKDGECTYELVTSSIVSSNSQCVYFKRIAHTQ